MPDKGWGLGEMSRGDGEEEVVKKKKEEHGEKGELLRKERDIFGKMT